MNMVSKKNAKITALAVVIFFIFIAAFYFIGRQAVVEELPVGYTNPTDTAEVFLEIWHERGALAGRSLSERMTMTNNLMTRNFALSLAQVEEEDGLIDPVTCLYVQAGEVRLTRQEIDSERGEATIRASQFPTAAETQNIIMRLTSSGGEWRISDISCAE